MPRYNFHKVEGGTIDLPSGRWYWYLTQLLLLPEEACVFQTLVLAHADEAGSTMRLRVPPELADLSMDQVAELAVNPEERTILIDGRQYRVQHSDDDVTEPMWLVKGPHHRRWRTDWEIEVPLGALEESDMVAIVRMGG